MNKLILLLILGVAAIAASEVIYEQVEVRRQIIDNYMEGSPKELFKVFHMLFKKPYSLNSETALQKYRVFKQNLDFIKNHNAKKLSWTLEVNFFADLTKEELNAYTGIKPINSIETTVDSLIGNKKYELFDQLVEAEKGRRKLYSFDFFDKYAEKEDTKKDDKDDPEPPRKSVGDYEELEFKKYLSEPRDQGGCGSCWAHASTLSIEAQFNKKAAETGTPFTPYTSVQELVDCAAPGSYGCNGGWMNASYNYLSQSGVVSDKEYPYTATDGTCATSGKTIMFKLNSTTSYKGCSFYSYYFKVPLCTKDVWYSTLKTGPVAVVVNAEMNFAYYRSGIIDSTNIDCSGYNHAVVAYSWKKEATSTSTKDYIEIRNSWGPYWGDRGDIRYYYNEDNGTCWITKMAFQPILA